MQMYQIKVGSYTKPGTYDEREANKIKSELQHCVKDEIELIPVKQGATV